MIDLLDIIGIETGNSGVNMSSFYSNILSIEESKLLIKKYSDIFIGNREPLSLLWENIDYNLRKKSFIR
jgi:hypothetical protein